MNHKTLTLSFLSLLITQTSFACFTGNTKLPNGKTIAKMEKKRLSYMAHDEFTVSHKVKFELVGSHSGDALQFVSSSGKKIFPGLVTPGHGVLIFENGKLNGIEAKNIRVGHKIVATNIGILNVKKVVKTQYEGPLYCIRPIDTNDDFAFYSLNKFGGLSILPE